MLMLVPAAVLVLVVLGAIAVDSAIAFLGQRELSGAAAAAANDAAGAAISEGAFYRPDGGEAAGRIVLDPAAAKELVSHALAARGPRGVTVAGAEVNVRGRQVCVALTGWVDYVFAKALPGFPKGTTVAARAVATTVEGGADTAVPTAAGC